MRVLATSVSLPDPDRPGFWLQLDAGTPDTHQVGDATLADLVSNPAAWTDLDLPDDDMPADSLPVPSDGPEDGPADGPSPAGQEPPRSGKGATTDAWARFATDLGVDPGGRGRDDLIALLLEQALIDPEE
ncbi:hypothetical protein [Euzebya rosea]|uniref:hypothetical protein n=1 Tax=Euzebya rosea TaxID=2052804 RepID=UPI00130071B7|nr:hypothetical protein [Euzebya rosea]